MTSGNQTDVAPTAHTDNSMHLDPQALHVIFGTGPLGMAVMGELVRQGARVRMVNRHGRADVPPGVEVVQADATDPASATAVTAGASVIYQCAQPAYTEWVTHFPAYQTAILAAAAAHNAKLVLAENLYMYGPVDGAMTEELPFNATTRKGRVRAQMADEWLAAHRAGRVRATAGRGSDFYGPRAGAQGAFGDRIIPPLLAGKGVAGLGDLDAPHTYTYVEDFGRGLVILGAHDEADGQAWHIPNAPTRTTREMLTLLFAAAGLPPKIGSTPTLVLRALGLVNPTIREVVEMLYEFTAPFVVDSSKFVRAFGDIATPAPVALGATLAWFRQSAGVRG